MAQFPKFYVVTMEKGVRVTQHHLQFPTIEKARRVASAMPLAHKILEIPHRRAEAVWHDLEPSVASNAHPIFENILNSIWRVA